MGREFWRTIRMAIQQDNWTARLVVVFCGAGAAALAVYVITTAR
ncbi:hypothetical protein OG259_38170 [Streptomyces sp. NBC_00250]|nr:hypothetical protein [Streptomyces sp. NBC_00250]